jgi:hypothetical protein
VAREHETPGLATGIFDDDLRLGDIDALALETPLHIRAQSPPQQDDFEAGEGQDGPESEHREGAGDAQSHGADQPEENARRARAQRAMRSQFDVAGGG